MLQIKSLIMHTFSEFLHRLNNNEWEQSFWRHFTQVLNCMSIHSYNTSSLSTAEKMARTEET